MSYAEWMAREDELARIKMLGESLADEFAESLLTSHLVAVGDEFFDTRLVPAEIAAGELLPGSTRERIGEAIQWLDSRGRLERHKDEPAWVKVIEDVAD